MQPIADGAMSPWEPGVFSLAVYAILVLAFIASQLFLAAWVGEKEKDGRKITAL